MASSECTSYQCMADVSEFYTRIKRKIQKLETEIKKLSEELRDLTKTYSRDINTCIGTTIWKIPDIDNKINRRQTTDGPFFTTGKFGYKLKPRVRFHESTMSVYVVVCRGEYDDLLAWPFQQTIKIEILDAFTRKHLSVSFKPDNCKEFQQPSSECNGAYGFEDLLKLEELKSKYIKNDTLYIKLKVSEYSL